ncbi:flagellar biosynthesis protein FlhA [Paramaledivibacter caminithermalis]|jgi:flagellar biosynthesis protein FlhA|uniref:Flagellar biosynthesis protein FlhA n=1 Tax=Paramaledivibacter caminithermalis (strain DSM 15212 / CIP 107654 / DViRD3) TaxID=1121301 RepID=A0A1M6N6V5_PARC5|nr:flagellar biosynthesis protein FlhA [Paramaledivibacter caminithermalis]SHJ91403.1 flagellar biosynthesis protein FlhA [Paramaledivibacter caminithermalis DSM 15212]
MKFGGIIVAVGIIAIVMIIIIPVPLMVLDFLLSVNISLGLLILLISIYNKEPLQFSVFPSLLLVTTLFRLSLNISTTRYILKDGNAGNVIEAFGNFVIGGNAIVGFIIFMIIIVIQFLVITKGSERVSEVAARFTLDAMPGKQMAIDADLNSGLITESEAKDRRMRIQKEADFYGAMDGASKFVKGDAVAGIIITIINIVAGFIIGSFMNGMEISEAMQRYTLLTVGDGLVSQIPALLISTGTGIVVTRAASDSDLGNDLIKQLFRQPKIMFIIAGVLFVLGITPLPNTPYFMLSATFVFLGYILRKEIIKNESIELEEVEEAEVEEIRKPENIMPLLQVDPIELEFGYGIIPLADPNQGGDLFDRLVMIRRQIALELGMVVPMIRLRDNIQLDANKYLIKIKGTEVSDGSIMFNHYLAMNPGNASGDIEGIDTIEPAFGLPAKWITEANREKAEILGYTVVDPSSIISTHLTEIIKKYSYELLGRQEVKTLIDSVKEEQSALVDELVPKLMSYGEIQKVLCNLLKERVSIRDLVTILETLADYCLITKDTNMLTEYVRQSLGRAITKQYIQNKRAKVVMLDPNLEKLIMESIKQSEHGSYLSLEPSVVQVILNNLSTEIQKLVSIGEQPIVITAPIVRYYFKSLTEQSIPDLIVLSYNEIDTDVEIQSIGTVKI